MATDNERLFINLFVLLVWLVPMAAAEITVASRHGNASSITPLHGSQLAVVWESFGAQEFDVTREAVRIHRDDWDCGTCPQKFIGDPKAISGKIVVWNHDAFWEGCSFCSYGAFQTFARELSKANATGFVLISKRMAANPLDGPGFVSRIVYAGQTRDPPDLRGFIFLDARSPGPLLECFYGIPDTSAGSLSSSSSGDGGIEAEASVFVVRLRSGDENWWDSPRDNGPWWAFQVLHPTHPLDTLAIALPFFFQFEFGVSLFPSLYNLLRSFAFLQRFFLA